MPSIQLHRQIADLPSPAQLGLRLAVSAGEALPAELAQRLRLRAREAGA